MNRINARFCILSMKHGVVGLGVSNAIYETTASTTNVFLTAYLQGHLNAYNGSRFESRNRVLLEGNVDFE
jgi:hypothetical protein